MKTLREIVKKMTTSGYLSGSCDTDKAVNQAIVAIKALLPNKKELETVAASTILKWMKHPEWKTDKFAKVLVKAITKLIEERIK